MFDDVFSEAVETGGRSRLSQLWERVWPPAVLAGIAAAVVTLLVVAIALVLPSDPAPTAETTTAAGAKPARPPGPLPAIQVAIHTTGAPLSERSGPSTYSPVKGHITNGTNIGVLCQVYGQKITGPSGTSAWWEVDAHGLYISDGWLRFGTKRPTIPWCGAGTHRPVTATVQVGDDGLSMRTGPTTGDTKVGALTDGTRATVECRAWGSTIVGQVGTTAYWAKLTNGRYVSEAYLHWAPDQPFLPWCGEAPQSVPPTHSAFIAAAVAPAQAGEKIYHVPASVTIAQAILESGWGASTLTRVDHDLFGMKCFGVPGPIALGCRDYGTHECNPNGSCYATSASFRVYQSEADSFADHGLMLASLDRYQPAFAYETQPDKFAQGLQAGGYATSTTYAKNLIALMKKYDLYQYDRPPGPARKPA